MRQEEQDDKQLVMGIERGPHAPRRSHCEHRQRGSAQQSRCVQACGPPRHRHDQRQSQSVEADRHGHGHGHGRHGGDEAGQPERRRGVGAEAAQVPLERAVQRPQREARGQGVQQPEGPEAAADQHTSSELVQPLLPCGLVRVVLRSFPNALQRQAPDGHRRVPEAPETPSEEERQDQQHKAEDVRWTYQVVAASDVAVGPLGLQRKLHGKQQLRRRKGVAHGPEQPVADPLGLQREHHTAPRPMQLVFLRQLRIQILLQRGPREP
mmetsp:Transcript_6145/g.15627  ORF Transcript_6145/g.15627 Transcript_6145/m.15627 type:complete len:266 (-) Transcript_6145:76-873(-)